jgi:four helix bundle protein
MPRDFRTIQAWQLADELAVRVYQATEHFPKHEQYGLTQQVRRAAVSVPSNIAEGAARASNNEYLHFCSIALGSLAEVRYQLHLSCRLKYLDGSVQAELETLANRVGAALHGLMAAMRAQQ